MFTDHNPIVSAMKKKTELKSGRQTRHLATISEFTTDIQHIDGKDNVVADTLSRIPPQQVTLVDPSDVEQEDTMPGFMFDAGQPSQACALKMSLFLMVLSPYCAMFLLVRRDQLYQRAGEDWFLTQCIPYHILVHEQQSA